MEMCPAAALSALLHGGQSWGQEGMGCQEGKLESDGSAPRGTRLVLGKTVLLI